MKERRHKVHFAHSRSEGVGLCGLDGSITRMANMTTCRICMYRYLSEQAIWAPAFLEDLRKNAGARESNAVPVPAGLTAPTNGKVKGLGDGFARALSQQCDPQEIVRVLLAVDAPGDGPVQPVMQDGGSAADAGGVQKGKVTEDSGNTG